MNENVKKGGLGIACFVLSIVGFLTGFIGLGVVLDVIALILGIVALISKKQKNGLAIAGVIISIVGILIMTLFVGVLASLGSDEEDISNVPSPSSNIETNIQEETETPEAEVGTTYEEVELSTIFEELDSNALRAEQTYQDKYLSFTGYLNSIDSDGSYITVSATNDTFDFTTIFCYIKNDEQLSTITLLNTGDKIKIQGQITQIGEVIGYYLDIENIEKAE